ncbi:MAG TPA: non-heme iron oxygenase ferredoxin subunit [Actinomycetota bacterium]|nr:non-heme iron oxygenase ferredoxin subunit [Actinomycetota bacterium]
MGLVRICAATDVAEGEARRFAVEGREVCVVNLGEDGFRAIGDVCSHAQAYLHEGEVDLDDRTIECPRHGSTFDLDTGKARTLPATLPVPSYEVKTDNDDVYIEVS